MPETRRTHHCKKVVKEMGVGWASATLVCPDCEEEAKTNSGKISGQKIVFSSSRGWSSI